MTAVEPVTAVVLAASETRTGCTSCGSSDTATVDAFNGRRCAHCPPTLDVARVSRMAAGAFPRDAVAHVRAMRATVPPGAFDRDLAADLVAMGRPDAAFAYLRAWLADTADRRFAAASAALAGAVA